MHLIGPLAAGINGAQSGSATITARATGGPCLLYSDYQGTAMTYSADLPLDANGGLTVYVAESVDVVVYDQNHVLVRSWTEMVSDALVEVVSPAFGGADYVGGAAGYSRPVTLEAVLDRWLVSAGAPDWNVLTPAGIMSLMTALAMQMQVWNVRTYGATGLGVADESASIATCIAACAGSTPGGGIVWFPPGTYRIETALTVPDGVHILGAGAGLSIVDVDDATENVFDLTGCTGTAPTIISGIKIVAHQANSGAHVAASSVTPVIIRDCIVGSTFSRGNLVLLAGTSKVYIGTTQMIVGNSTTARAIGTASAGDLVCILESTLTGPANAYAPVPAMISADNIRMQNLIINLNTTGAATVTTVFAPNNAAAVALGGMVTGCTFTMSGASTSSIVFNLGQLSATRTFREDNNELSTTLTLWTATSLATRAPVYLGTRHRTTRITATGGGTTTVLPTDQYDTVYVDFPLLFNAMDIQSWAQAPFGCRVVVIGVNGFAGANPCANAPTNVVGVTAQLNMAFTAGGQYEVRTATAEETAAGGGNRWLLASCTNATATGNF